MCNCAITVLAMICSVRGARWLGSCFAVCADPEPAAKLQMLWRGSGRQSADCVEHQAHSNAMLAHADGMEASNVSVATLGPCEAQHMQT